MVPLGLPVDTEHQNLAGRPSARGWGYAGTEWRRGRAVLMKSARAAWVPGALRRRGG